MDLPEKPCVTVLAAARTIVEAALSAAGVFLLLRGSPMGRQSLIAVASGVFAIAIEGEVYAQNIENAVQYRSKKNSLWCKLIRKMLIDMHDAHAHPESDAAVRPYENSFLKRYAKKYNELLDLEHSLEHLLEKEAKDSEAEKKKKEEIEEKRKAIENIEWTLYWMEYAARFYLENTNDEGQLGEEAETVLDDTSIKSLGVIFGAKQYLEEALSPDLAAVAEKKKNFIDERDNKQGHTDWSHAVNAVSSVGAFLSMFSVVQQTMLFFGAATSIAMTGGIVIALLATAAYAVVTYNTFQQIIHNDLFSVYWGQFKRSYYSGDLLNKIKLIAGVAVFIALISTLTLATGGTWWHTGLAGQMTLMHISNFITTAFVVVVSSFYTFCTILFNVKNILETVDEFKDVTPQKVVNGIVNKLKTIFYEPAKEIFYQSMDEKNEWEKVAFYLFCVPAYVLRVATKVVFSVWFAVAFAGHCLSEGATVDDAVLISHQAAIGVNTAVEGLTDAHYVMGHFEEDAPKKKTLMEKIKARQEDSHHHNNIPSKVLCSVLMLPLLLCSVPYRVWGKKSSEEAFNTILSPKTVPQHMLRALVVVASPLLWVCVCDSLATGQSLKDTFKKIVKPHWQEPPHSHGHGDLGEVAAHSSDDAVERGESVTISKRRGEKNSSVPGKKTRLVPHFACSDECCSSEKAVPPPPPPFPHSELARAEATAQEEETKWQRQACVLELHEKSKELADKACYEDRLFPEGGKTARDKAKFFKEAYAMAKTGNELPKKADILDCPRYPSVDRCLGWLRGRPQKTQSTIDYERISCRYAAC